MARAYKATRFGSKFEIGGYPHREHRSKKGRKGAVMRFGKQQIYKAKKQALMDKQHEKEMVNV